MNKDEYVKEIIDLEWKAFDQVKNEGGRADCQNDFHTFSIMRKSQYLSWPLDLLESYYLDFINANQNHWNLITEKYGRMMEYTSPNEYEKLKDKFPYCTDQKIAIVNQIAEIQVNWMEEFAKIYPNMASNARSIRKEEDTKYNTSYETYLKGELLTYSDHTLKLYGRWIVELSNTNQNLAKMIMKNTALLYGYQTLEEAEQLLENHK